MTGAQPIAADWLALRRPVDEAARTVADPLVERCAAYLRAVEPPATVLDLGAGTGANRAYLAARLHLPLRWVLVDHDPALLALAAPESTRVRAKVSDVARLLASYEPALVTCSALLDLLTPQEISGLVAGLAAAHVPALFALTVDGKVRLDPVHADDQLLMAAFDRHQARAERAGPAAAEATRSAAETWGLVITEVETPWLLGPVTPGAMLERLLRERVAAAVEQDPSLSSRGERWLTERLAQVAKGRLRLEIGHVDLLLEPREGPSRPRSAQREHGADVVVEAEPV